MAHYRFNNLLGAPYRGGNLCMSGNHLLTSVGNRVMEVDRLMRSASTVLLMRWAVAAPGDAPPEGFQIRIEPDRHGLLA